MFISNVRVAAQPICKIEIHYDDNGNRIERKLVCIGKPARPEDTNSLALEELLDKSAFQVYPNPAKNNVNMKLNAASLAQQCSITLTDVAGRVLYWQVNIKNELSVIDLDKYADGTYFIILLRDKRNNTIKVAKQSGDGILDQLIKKRS